MVKEFTASLLADGAEASTAVSRQHAVRRFAAWAVEEGLLSEDPLLGLKLPKIDQKITECLTEEELKRLIKMCSGSDYRDRRDEAVVRLMTETGMRAGELLALRLVDVDLPSRAGGHHPRQGRERTHRAVRCADRESAGPLPACAQSHTLAPHRRHSG